MNLTLAEAWEKLKSDVLNDANADQLRGAEVIFCAGVAAGIAMVAHPDADSTEVLDQVLERTIALTKKPKVTIQ